MGYISMDHCQVEINALKQHLSGEKILTDDELQDLLNKFYIECNPKTKIKNDNYVKIIVIGRMIIYNNSIVNIFDVGDRYDKEP